MASFSFERLLILDNLAIFSSQNESFYFPFHFHEVFCLSLITQGIEQLTTENGNAFAPAGTISITNAGLVHQNQSALFDGYSYKTVYISPNLLTYLNNGRRILQFQTVIEDQVLYATISHLITTHCACVHSWEEALSLILKYQSNDRQLPNKASRFEPIDAIVDDHKDEKISLKDLSRRFHLSPYHFIREFKKEKGITPQAYIMLKRLQNVNKDLSQSLSLKEVAWSNGFYDISHLNYAFKKFFGTTISQYVNSNILH